MNSRRACQSRIKVPIAQFDILPNHSSGGLHLGQTGDRTKSPTINQMIESSSLYRLNLNAPTHSSLYIPATLIANGISWLSVEWSRMY